MLLSFFKKLGIQPLVMLPLLPSLFPHIPPLSPLPISEDPGFLFLTQRTLALSLWPSRPRRSQAHFPSQAANPVLFLNKISILRNLCDRY